MPHVIFQTVEGLTLVGEVRREWKDLPVLLITVIRDRVSVEGTFILSKFSL